MAKYELRQFRVAHMTYCPECGATGDYKLLKDAAVVVKQKLDDFIRANPHVAGQSSGQFADLHAAIGVLHSVIDKELRSRP